MGYFGDESFQAITCTGTDNTKKQEKICQRHRINELALDK